MRIARLQIKEYDRANFFSSSFHDFSSGFFLDVFITGRAYLFEHCVNVRIGPPEDRLLMTGLHSVNDIFCLRCKNMVGWTYSRAYETSQKYKEGKFIVEKINLHLEESDCYDVAPPAGERKDRFRARSISWGSDSHRRGGGDAGEATIYEYRPSSPVLRTPPSSPKRSSRHL